MTNYNQIEFGTRAKRESAFVWIYATKCASYAGYPYNNIPSTTLALTELRWDGFMGAVGGMVDKTDASIEDAVVRETMEEIGYAITADQLVPLRSYENPKTGFHFHSFSLQVSYEELLKIRNNAHTGEHFNAECAGVNLAHLCKYPKGKSEAGLSILKEQRWIGTSLLELDALIEDNDIVEDYTTYTLFLDDLRDSEQYFPKADNVITCRSYDEAVALVERRGMPKLVSFDHDLGDVQDQQDEKTGYTFAKYLVQRMQDQNITEKFDFQVHSANPIGAANITNLLNNWFNFMESK